MQGAFYLDGYGSATQCFVDSFVFIAVETEPPYMVGCYLLEDEYVGWGRIEYKRLLDLEMKCRTESKYPHYQDEGLKTIFKPNWL